MSESLRDLLRLAQQRNGNASGRQLSALADKAGHVLSHTTINHIFRGDYTSTPSRQTLEGIAGVAAVPLTRVYQAAGLPAPGPPFSTQLPPETDRLTPKQRAAIVTLIRAMLDPDPQTVGEPDRPGERTIYGEDGVMVRARLNADGGMSVVQVVAPPGSPESKQRVGKVRNNPQRKR